MTYAGIKPMTELYILIWKDLIDSKKKGYKILYIDIIQCLLCKK